MSVFLVFANSCKNSGNTFTDPRDGKVYQTVIIGNQEWMAENLAYAPSSGNYWAYHNNNENFETYGYLYDWETACDVCPDGWHLPSDDEWTELTDYLGGEDVAGGKLKEKGRTHWTRPNGGATNESGFSALPGGYYLNLDGGFNSIGENGCWWSATEDTTHNVWYRLMFYDYSNVYRTYTYKKMGLSVRCVRDE
ncbi:MAG: FISUMP domain-containing protein [Bacteroidales bacterium]